MRWEGLDVRLEYRSMVHSRSRSLSNTTLATFVDYFNVPYSLSIGVSDLEM